MSQAKLLMFLNITYMKGSQDWFKLPTLGFCLVN